LSLKQIQALVRNGIYYLTEHAYDVESSILTGKIRKTWPREGKFEIVGAALDGRRMGTVCRITQTNKLRVITAYEDRPKT
jgi:hypothetical protein